MRRRDGKPPARQAAKTEAEKQHLRELAEAGIAGRYLIARHTPEEGGRFYYIGPFPSAGSATRWQREHSIVCQLELPDIQPDNDEEIVAP